jgi:predicted AlkP superfamily phosphohydrolase/phosphomutase
VPPDCKYADGYDLWRYEAGKNLLYLLCYIHNKNFKSTALGWGAEANFKQSSHPSGLLKEIFSKFGHHPLEGWYQKVINDLNEWKELQKKLLEGVRIRTSIVKWLLKKEPWDFFLIGFAETHWAGHYFWHLIDESNPGFNPDIAKVCGDAILEVYKEVDRF